MNELVANAVPVIRTEPIRGGDAKKTAESDQFGRVYRCKLRGGPLAGGEVPLTMLPHDDVLRFFRKGQRGRFVKAPYLISGWDGDDVVADYIGA